VGIGRNQGPKSTLAKIMMTAISQLRCGVGVSIIYALDISLGAMLRHHHRPPAPTIIPCRNTPSTVQLLLDLGADIASEF